MRAYLMTTGLLFGVLAVLHVWRAVAEWPSTSPGTGFILGMTALIAVPGVLAWWAWRLVRKLPARSDAPPKDSGK
jgi:tetrahydromethanopterin S-methyltransferase subunit E